MSLLDDRQIQNALHASGRKLSITTDTIFKFVFGSPDSSHILQSLLNALLGPYVDAPFEHLSILNGEYPSPDYAMKSNRMDIVAADSAGRIINVEAQMYTDNWYAERLTVYVSRLVTYYTPRGGKETTIQKVVGLSIGEGPLPGLEDYPDPVVDIRSRPKKEGFELRGNLPVTVHVNLSLIRRQYEKLEPENFDEAMRWCYYLAMEAKTMITDEEHRKIGRIIASDPNVREADRRFREAMAGNDEKLKFALLQSWNAEMRYAGEMATATVQAESEGLARGMQRGMQQGMEQGMQQGLAVGIEKGIEKGKLDTAQAMKADGIPMETIGRYTGLSQKQIEAL